MESYKLHKHEEPKNMFLRHFANLFLNPEYSDLTIFCGNEAFPVHKIFVQPVLNQLQNMQKAPGEIPFSSFDPFVMRKALEFIYKGQYAAESPPIDNCTDGRDLNCSVNNPRKRKRLRLPYVASSGIDWAYFHPSILHLRMYAAASELAFHRLRHHAMQAVIASLGTLFDHDQFAVFIQDLYAEEKYRALRDPAMNVITANLHRFKANGYNLIDDELLGKVPNFRDHLLATLMDRTCHKKLTSGPLNADTICDCSFPGATSHNDHPRVACTIFLNEKIILSSIEKQFLNSSYSDLTLVCGQQVFPAHKAILCSSSGYFLRACRGNFKEASGKIQLNAHDPIFVKNALEFLYKGKYTEVSGDFLHSAKSIPCFHARMFAMADYLDIDDLKTEAIGLIFDTLLENLERHVFVTLVHEIYTESASYAEVREALFEVMFNDLIKSPRWDWDWINDLYHDSEFGRDLLFFWPIKEELVYRKCGGGAYAPPELSVDTSPRLPACISTRGSPKKGGAGSS